MFNSLLILYSKEYTNSILNAKCSNMGLKFMHMCTSTHFFKYLYVWSSIREVLNTGQHSLANLLIMGEVINKFIIKYNRAQSYHFYILSKCELSMGFLTKFYLNASQGFFLQIYQE